jgi:hypothetical protein
VQIGIFMGQRYNTYDSEIYIYFENVNIYTYIYMHKMYMYV